MHIHWLIFIVK